MIKFLSKNIAYNFIAIIVSFYSTRVVVNMLGVNDYGFWISLFAICSWIQFLDGGFGNSIRNSVSKSISILDFKAVSKTVSNGYIGMGILTIASLIILLMIIVFIPISKIISIPSNINIIPYAFILYGFSIIVIFLKIINKVCFSINRSDLVFINLLITNSIILLLLYLFKSMHMNPLYVVLYSYSIAPIIVLVIFSYYVLKNQKLEISIAFFDIMELKSLLNFGGAFFMIQLSFGFILGFLPIFINAIWDGFITAEYQIIQKLLGLLFILSNIILQSKWHSLSLITGRKQIKKHQLNNILLFLLHFAGVCVIYVFLKEIVKLWIGNSELIITDGMSLSVLNLTCSILFSKFSAIILMSKNIINQQKYISIIQLLFFLIWSFIVYKFNISLVLFINIISIGFYIQGLLGNKQVLSLK